ncbi:hypothetical protein Tco_0146259 [Tanacetum coccineum]
MACIEELANVGEFNKTEDQLLVLIEKQVETELKLEEKFRELCEEVSNVVKEKEDVVEELERLNDEFAIAANSRGLFNRMLVYFDRENGKHLDFANGLHNLWAELLDCTNERQLFITEPEGLCLSVMTYKILKFLNEVLNHDVIQLLELRKMIVGTHQQVSRKIALIETIRSL